MGWIGSLITVGALLMCIPTGFICDLIGRRTTLLLLIIPFGIGWSLIIWAKNVVMLYFGRVFTGVGVGACCVAAPLYTNEIADKNIRGSLGSYFQLMVTAGILYAYIMGSLLNIKTYTFSCAFCICLFSILFFFQPETPLYFVRKNNFEKAKQSLLKLRGKNCDVDSELREIELQVKEHSESTASLQHVLKQKSTIKAIIISLGLMFFQQFSGINVIIMYSSDIFKESGASWDPNLACIIVAVFQVVATFTSSLLIDTLGRRKLLIISDAVMALSSVVLGLYFTLKTHKIINESILHHLSSVPVIALCIFVVVFSIGFGPIPWMISAEIFIPQLKSIAGSVAGTLNWFLAFLITKFYIDVKNAVGDDVTFYIFSAISCLGAVFVYFIVPETKGKTVDDIQRELSM